LFVGYKPKTSLTPFVLWTKNEKKVSQDALRDLRKMHYSNLFKIETKDYSIYKPDYFPITKENWKVISSQNYRLLKSIERFVSNNVLTRINNVFNVSQGIRTGNNSIFKISELEYLGLPKDEQKYFKPVIDNEAIKDGQLQKKSYVWYPYDKNGIVIHTEEQLNMKVPFFYENTLVPSKSILINRENINVSNWWYLSRPRDWLRETTPRLVSTEFGNSDSFAFDPEGMFAIERGNAWIPKKDFTHIDYYYFYLSIFSSPFFDELLSIYSKQLAGGNWYDLGKKHTRDIPIPNIFSEQILYSFAYSKLVEIGKEISNGNYYLRTKADDILLKFIYPIDS